MWCIKPNNLQEQQFIGKWFDENNSLPARKNNFYKDSKITDMYYVFGKGKGDVFYSRPFGKIYTYREFTTEFINKNIEPQYEIY